MIRTINSWRGLMAVTVVLFHAGVDWMWNVAVTGVTFFFISSTFLLAMRHPFERLTADNYRRFAIGHALRLYPLHWLGLALLIAIELTICDASIDWGATALSALLLQAWSPVHDVHYGINPVAWYMSALLFCYLVYPFVAHALGHWRLRYKLLLALALAVILSLILYPLNIPQREAVFVNPLSHILDVVVGLVLIHCYKVCKDRFPKVGFAAATIIEIGALSLLALAITVNITTTWIKPWEDVLNWLLPQGAILLTLAFLDGQEGLVGRLLLCKPLQWLGSISFEVYVLQFVAFLLFNYVVAPFVAHFGLLIYDQVEWLSMLLLLPMSWLVNRYFTRPVFRRLRRLYETK